MTEPQSVPAKKLRSYLNRVTTAIGAVGVLLLIAALAFAFLSMPLGDATAISTILGTFVALAGFLLTKQGLRSSNAFQVTAIVCIYAAAALVSVLAVRAADDSSGHPAALTPSSTPAANTSASMTTSASPTGTATASTTLTQGPPTQTIKTPVQPPTATTPSCPVQTTFTAAPNPVKVDEIVQFTGKGYPPGSLVDIDIYQRPPFGDGHLFDVVDDLATDVCGGFQYTWRVPASYQTDGRRDVGVRAPNQYGPGDPRYQDPLVILDLLWAG